MEEVKTDPEIELPSNAIELISTLSEILITKLTCNTILNNFMMSHNLHFRKISNGLLWIKFNYDDFISFLKEDDDDETIINLMYEHVSWMSFELMEKEREKMKDELSAEELKKMKDLIESKHISKGFFFVLYIYKNIQGNEKKPLILKNDMNFIPSCIKLEDVNIISPKEQFRGENDIKKFFSQQKKELKVKNFSDTFEKKKSNYIKNGKGFTHVAMINGKTYSFIFKDWK